MCMCVLGVSLPSLYQDRKVNGHVYVCVRGIEFPSFYDFNILFCNCSDSFSFVCVFMLIIYDSIEYTSRDDICVNHI
jgi:hypothetical protein